MADREIVIRIPEDKYDRLMQQTRGDMYLLGCLFAVNRLIEKGSSDYGVKVDGKWETVPWVEIKEWIEKQYGIEQ